MIDVTNQQVSFRDLSKSTNQATTEHMDLPPDTSNGLLMPLIQNMQDNTPDRGLVCCPRTQAANGEASHC